MDPQQMEGYVRLIISIYAGIPLGYYLLIALIWIGIMTPILRNMER